MKHLIYAFFGLLFLFTAVVWAAGLPFSATYFTVQRLEPAPLLLFNGDITAQQLRETVVNGFYFMPAEVVHLADVAALLDVRALVLPWLLTLSVLMIVALWRRTYYAAGWALGWYVALVGGALMLWAAAGDRAVRDVMHGVLFPQGGYLFPPNSLIRQLYPTEVIQGGLVFVLLVTSLAVLLLWAVSALAKPKQKAV